MAEQEQDFEKVIEELEAEARADFDIRDRLAGRSRREDTITIYTDEVLADELGDARDEDVYTGFVKTGAQRVREGILGRIDEIELDPEQHEELAELKAKAKELREQLEASAFVFTLRAVPEGVIDGCRREAKRRVGVKKGKVPEALAQEYGDFLTAEVFARVVHKFEDRQTGTVLEKLKPGFFLALKGDLPNGEWGRLDAKINDVQFKQAIGERAVQDVDFS